LGDRAEYRACRKDYEAVAPQSADLLRCGPFENTSGNIRCDQNVGERQEVADSPDAEQLLVRAEKTIAVR
jgi:hypothetical protein